MKRECIGYGERWIHKVEEDFILMGENDEKIDRCKDAVIGIRMNESLELEVNIDAWLGATGSRSTLKREWTKLMDQQKEIGYVKVY